MLRDQIRSRGFRIAIALAIVCIVLSYIKIPDETLDKWLGPEQPEIYQTSGVAFKGNLMVPMTVLTEEEMIIQEEKGCGGCHEI